MNGLHSMGVMKEGEAMKFLIAGGDERAVFLANALCADGAQVACLAMDTAPLDPPVTKTRVCESADCIVLPLPAETGRLGVLNAPYSTEQVSVHALLRTLPEGSLVCGGKLSQRLKDTAKSCRLRCFDYLSRPEFTVGNAAITAEAAVYTLMRESRTALFASSVLIIGYGRIGKLLSAKLAALGARVSVVSRNPESRAMAEAAGFNALAPDAPFESPQMLVNTAPGPVLTAPRLDALDRSCIILELASPPYGIDPLWAQRSGFRYCAAPGLPGKYAPESAAELIKCAVNNIVKENVV